MSKISMDQIKELRDESGVSIMQCQKALVEAEGDMEKARIILAKKSKEAAAKKADRETSNGTVTAVELGEGNIALFTLLCETDFVAKNEDFTKLANNLAAIVKEKGTEKMQEESQLIMDPVVQKVGENIRLGKVEQIKGEFTASYVHGGAIGVITALDGGDAELARDIAMHISAMRPLYITNDDIDEAAKNAAISVFKEEMETLDKPQEMKDKILAGKIDAYFKEMTLMNQNFIKNPEITIEKLLESKGAKLVAFKSAFLG